MRLDRAEFAVGAAVFARVPLDQALASTPAGLSEEIEVAGGDSPREGTLRMIRLWYVRILRSVPADEEILGEELVRFEEVDTGDFGISEEFDGDSAMEPERRMGCCHCCGLVEGAVGEQSWVRSWQAEAALEACSRLDSAD